MPCRGSKRILKARAHSSCIPLLLVVVAALPLFKLELLALLIALPLLFWLFRLANVTVLGPVEEEDELSDTDDVFVVRLSRLGEDDDAAGL